MLGAHAIKQTELALLVRFDDKRELWVPQSQIHDDSEVYAVGDTGKLVVARWWAEREGLDEAGE